MCFGLQTAMSITMKQSRGQTLLSRYVWQIMQCKVQCDHVNKMANCNNDQIFSFNVICHFMLLKAVHKTLDQLATRDRSQFRAVIVKTCVPYLRHLSNVNGILTSVLSQLSMQQCTAI